MNIAEMDVKIEKLFKLLEEKIEMLDSESIEEKMKLTKKTFLRQKAEWDDSIDSIQQKISNAKESARILGDEISMQKEKVYSEIKECSIENEKLNDKWEQKFSAMLEGMTKKLESIETFYEKTKTTVEGYDEILFKFADKIASLEVQQSLAEQRMDSMIFNVNDASAKLDKIYIWLEKYKKSSWFDKIIGRVK